jgi:hypothetical protein
MNQFNGSILVDGHDLSFDFLVIHTVKGIKLFIVVTKDRTSFIFDMQKDGSGKWKILEPAPKWVIPFAEQLGNTIDKNI